MGVIPLGVYSTTKSSRVQSVINCVWCTDSLTDLAKPADDSNLNVL